MAGKCLELPTIYAFGSNGSGQLGIGHTNDTARPEKCIFRPRHQDDLDHSDSGESEATASTVTVVRKIVAGGNHTLILMKDGRVFAAGNAGLEDQDVKVEFEQQLFDVEGHVTDVAATWEASFVVVDRRRVFVRGSGAKGELGLGNGVVTADKMTRVLDVDDLDVCPGEQHADAKIFDIAACMSHVVVLLSDGRVFGWGSCRKGQLGDQFRQHKILWEPTRIDVGLPFQPQRVVVGRDYTVFLHGVWGEVKDLNEEVLQQPVNGGDTVASGWSSIHTLSSGQVRSVGNNNHGQFALANMPTILGLAAGSEHCVALTQSNQVIAWGWGEHGNCGEELDSKGNVAGRWNVIPMSRQDDATQILDVAAGCATSFVIGGRTDPD
ncbi:alpha tubulin suppressor [Elasticomyces elasticus]|uniref:Alpha tubulin suppressor n=1 Tax=Exophiala sideris TaxID=1016849 RepID=A0ABR0J9V9_9EURO|nr:alpha tubulin suppressor [Elasticomyces elasticus]KAK5027847.1 alpha tubulin suppressor [Exophiala sideris]KAK5037564.1 alpha tubulin suppressor [Exophiala sideris]KAK5059225.1 alpha tubulin suppressor [Exophiala sideris]KAK5183059.1 alpha tubulin suppressor [Eurotiomycetes sp. CCFEE 6388]